MTTRSGHHRALAGHSDRAALGSWWASDRSFQPDRKVGGPLVGWGAVCRLHTSHRGPPGAGHSVVPAAPGPAAVAEPPPSPSTAPFSTAQPGSRTAGSTFGTVKRGEKRARRRQASDRSPRGHGESRPQRSQQKNPERQLIWANGGSVMGRQVGHVGRRKHKCGHGTRGRALQGLGLGSQRGPRVPSGPTAPALGTLHESNQQKG